MSSSSSSVAARGGVASVKVRISLSLSLSLSRFVLARGELFRFIIGGGSPPLTRAKKKKRLSPAMMMMVFFDATIKKDDLSFGGGVRGMDRIALVAFYVLGGDLPRGDLRLKGRHIVIVIDVTPRAQGGDQIEFVYLSPSHHRSRCVSLVVVSSSRHHRETKNALFCIEDEEKEKNLH